MQLHAQRMCLHTYICTYILLSSYLGHYLPRNVLQLYLQRRRGLRRHLCHQRGGAKQWQLPLRAARHLQVHVQNRHHLVPLRRSTLRDEVWLLDLRWLSGECSGRSSNSGVYRISTWHQSAATWHMPRAANTALPYIIFNVRLQLARHK